MILEQPVDLFLQPAVQGQAEAAGSLPELGIERREADARDERPGGSPPEIEVSQGRFMAIENIVDPPRAQRAVEAAQELQGLGVDLAEGGGKAGDGRFRPGRIQAGGTAESVVPADLVAPPGQQVVAVGLELHRFAAVEKEGEELARAQRGRGSGAAQFVEARRGRLRAAADQLHQGLQLQGVPPLEKPGPPLLQPSPGLVRAIAQQQFLDLIHQGAGIPPGQAEEEGGGKRQQQEHPQQTPAAAQRALLEGKGDVLVIQHPQLPARVPARSRGPLARPMLMASGTLPACPTPRGYPAWTWRRRCAGARGRRRPSPAPG